MKAVELFCGMGMSDLGAVQAGFELVGACDFEPYTIKALNSQKVLPPVGKVSKVGDYDFGDCDLLGAGPVCKAFSPGATVFGTGGQADGRNTFPEFLSLLERHPGIPYVLIENSYGLQRFGTYLQEIMDRLKALGYAVDFGEVDCWDYGVPQRRRRVVFLCSKSGEWRITKPANATGFRTVGDCLFPPPAADPWPLLIPLSEKAVAYYAGHDGIHLKKHPPLTAGRAASTVFSNYKKGVPYGVVEHEGKYWTCGPRLAARLQGLPDDYDLSSMSRTQALEAIGNGFPPQVVRWLVRTIPGG